MSSADRDKTCVRCRVFGRVQGVFYRASARNRAAELGLSGFARNLKDGSVEVLACGERAAVQALCDWLWEGPSAAAVEDVHCIEQDFQEHAGFHTA